MSGPGCSSWGMRWWWDVGDANYGLGGEESYGSRWGEASNKQAALHVLRIGSATVFAVLQVSTSDTTGGRGSG